MSTAQEFFHATKAGQTAKVRSLLDRNPGLVKASEEWNRTPLHYAARNGHYDITTLLLLYGADVNATDVLHRSNPLGWASVLGTAQLDLSEFLIQRGATLDIFASVALNKIEAVKRLVGISNERALRNHFLSGLGKETVKAVVRHDPGVLKARMTPHDDARQPIHLAVIKNLPGMVELLIESGADIHAKTASGRTPLCLAAEWRHDEIIDLLLSKGAVLDLPASLALQRQDYTAERLRAALLRVEQKHILNRRRNRKQALL